VDVALLAYFFFWYLGNYYYNIANKVCLKAAGGALRPLGIQYLSR